MSAIGCSSNDNDATEYTRLADETIMHELGIGYDGSDRRLPFEADYCKRNILMERVVNRSSLAFHAKGH